MTPSFDAVVVGAGVVGSATAAFLAADGLTVLLVESDDVASAASGRNSGVVQHPFDPVLAELYRETIQLLRELEAAEPGRFHLPAQPVGLLYLGEDAAAARQLTEAFARSQPGLAPTFLAGRDLQAAEPSLAPDLAACRLAIGYPVAPARATRAWAGLARDRGALVAIRETAQIDRTEGRVHGVRIDGRRVAAGAVVVAAGPWTPGVVDPTGRWRPIRPLWGAVVEIRLSSPPVHVLEELEIDATIEPERIEAPSAASAVPVAFSLVTADGRSVVGSTFTIDEPNDAALVPSLLARAGRFLPNASAAEVLGSRRCARPLSFDGRPLVGRVPGVDNLFVAAGHGPWGISTGAASARMVADLVLGRIETPPDALDPARFVPAPEIRGGS
ncbi:MAG TPA: FAD-dependent oxidoreductase [Vitreimonas sp.]|nr:FAD-dependent oxidoreductase [Vitreimonas sp.]